MNLESFLLKEESAIARKWFQMIADTYPAETARLLVKEKNQFANPVGQTIHHAVTGIVAEMLRGNDPDKIAPLLDRIIRIRAVQDFTPSQATAFIFRFKNIIRETLQDEIRENRISRDDLLTFEAKVDELALLAFNIYAQCREKLYEIRVNEVKNRTHRLLQRANLIAEIPEPGPESEK